VTEVEKIDCAQAADRILDFAEFFLSLGDLKPPDLLIAIANHDPLFTYYFEEVKEPIETALDFLRIYADWALAEVLKKCIASRQEVCAAAVASEKYRLLKMQWSRQTLLWDEVVRMMGGW
jgi:hypothetical protein